VGLAVLVANSPTEKVLETAVEDSLPDSLGGNLQSEGDRNEASDNVEDVTQSTNRSTSIRPSKAETTSVPGHQKGGEIEHEEVGPGTEAADAAVRSDMHLEAGGEVLNSLQRYVSRAT
jgi:hypothetical protein